MAMLQSTAADVSLASAAALILVADLCAFQGYFSAGPHVQRGTYEAGAEAQAAVVGHSSVCVVFCVLFLVGQSQNRH